MNLVASGSDWIFHKFVSVMMNSATDSMLKSGMATNIVGGKHGGVDGATSSYILREAEVLDDATDNDVEMET